MRCRWLIGLCLLLQGCQFKNDVIDPTDIIEVQEGQGIENEISVQDYIFLKTSVDDLFYVDDDLTQYKLSDQVDYFYYDELRQVLNVKKTSGEWVVWSLNNQKPTFIDEATYILSMPQPHQVYYTKADGGLYVMNRLVEQLVVETAPLMIDVTQDGKFIMWVDEHNTLTVLDEEANVTFEMEHVSAYEFDELSQTIKLYKDGCVEIYVFEDEQLHLFNAYESVNDWWNAPRYSSQFETIAYLEDEQNESGAGVLKIISKHSRIEQEVMNVLEYAINETGEYIFCLNDKYELYVVDIKQEQQYFIGKQELDFNLKQFVTTSVFRQGDSLYKVNEQFQVYPLFDNVKHYEVLNDVICFVDSYNDLYIIRQDVVEKVSDQVKSFSLGVNGLFYFRDNTIFYTRFDQVETILVENVNYYDRVFHGNTELYQTTLTTSDLYGMWEYLSESFVVQYTFNDDETIIMKVIDNENETVLSGSFHIMGITTGSMNIRVILETGEERYLTLNHEGINQLTIAEDEHVWLFSKRLP